MEDVKNTPLALPELFFITARSFTTGAHAIVKSTMRARYDNDARFIMSCEMLVGHAVEVYLKAWLAKHDERYNKSNLSFKPFGHNLRNLYNKAREEGFPEPDAPVQQSFNDLVESFETPHGDYAFRYPTDGWSFNVPKNDILFDILKRLDAVVAHKLGKHIPDNLDWSVSADEDFRSST
jgi:hypothetical protein